MKTRRLLPWLLLLSPTVVEGQGENAGTPIFQTSSAFFALSVRDLGASVRWYTEKLGLGIAMRAARTDDTRSAMTLLRGGGLTVELVQHDDAVPLRTMLPAPRGALYVHGIFKVGMVVDDFDGTLAAIRARGIPIAIGPFPRRADQPANLMIRDAEGNYIQVFGRND
jgi:catechol 2,3-dioxygenase-like lactoylglutathione lyase family enzyme